MLCTETLHTESDAFYYSIRRKNLFCNHPRFQVVLQKSIFKFCISVYYYFLIVKCFVLLRAEVNVYHAILDGGS